MADINITNGTILESLNNKADIDGGNYKGSGLQAVLEETTLGTQGGTMDEGAQINFQNKDANTYCGIKVNNKFADSTQSTLTTQENYMFFSCVDKNSKITGEVLTKHMTSGAVASVLRAYGNSTGSSVMAELQVAVDKNGNTLCSFPKCTTKATTTSSAASNKVAVVVQNYVSGTSWYRVWSDGWIEQGGRVSLGNGANTTIKLLKNFSNTNYGALGIGSHTGSVGVCFIYDKTTSSFVFKNSANTSNDTTWYAYGY